MLTQETIDAYCTLLHRELIPATGCTEPIAIAYAAAVMRETLGSLPDHLRVAVSGNIIKNAKSVVVPGTGGKKGIAAAAVAGVVAGKSEKLLEVIDAIRPEERDGISAYLTSTPITVECIEVHDAGYSHHRKPRRGQRVCPYRGCAYQCGAHRAKRRSPVRSADRSGGA